MRSEGNSGGERGKVKGKGNWEGLRGGGIRRESRGGG